MIIENSSISFQQQHQKQSISKQSESLNMWIGERPSPPSRPTLPPAASVQAHISTAAALQPQKETAELADHKLKASDELRMQIIIRMVEALTGRKFELFDPAELEKAVNESEAADTVTTSPEGRPAAGFGIEYDYYVSHYEYESLSFEATGTVTTRDGKTITLSAQLNVQREFFEETSISLRAGDAIKIDPLVLNFNGTAAELQDTRFEFDLDADGRSEQIALLQPGNAYLALDKNQDGKINNGSELFGPSSGNGFNELSRYDEDGNRFIDEADSIYDQLRLWFRNADGSQQLVGLGQQGIGAIYLGHLNTPFELQQQGETLGDLASSGIYLNEDGSSGFIQQVDLRV